MLLILISQCQTKRVERNLSFDGFWTCSVFPDHWRIDTSSTNCCVKCIQLMIAMLCAVVSWQGRLLSALHQSVCEIAQKGNIDFAGRQLRLCHFHAIKDSLYWTRFCLCDWCCTCYPRCSATQISSRMRKLLRESSRIMQPKFQRHFCCKLAAYNERIKSNTQLPIICLFILP